MLQFFQKKMHKSKKGFTLIELIVVIAILGILAAIAVPRLIGFQDRARAQADNQTAAQIKNAVGLLYANGEIKLVPEDATTPVELFARFSISAAGAVTHVAADAANWAVPTSATADARLTALLTTPATGLVSDYKLQNKAGRTIWVRVSSRGAVNTVLAAAMPATDAEWIP